MCKTFMEKITKTALNNIKDDNICRDITGSWKTRQDQEDDNSVPILIYKCHGIKIKIPTEF